MDFYRPPTSQGTLDALGALYRAMRALRFYPNGHPARRNTITIAHAALLVLLDGNTLMLACGSGGFSFPDGEFLKDTSGLSSALSFELFARRVQKITFCPDLFSEDLLEFGRILSISPEQTRQAGGFDQLLAEHGVRSIWVNEFDLLAISRKRHQVEQSGVVPQGLDDTEGAGSGEGAVETTVPMQEALPAELQLQTLLGRLASCSDADTYLILIRQTISVAETLLACHQLLPLLPLLELLASQMQDDSHSEAMRDCAHFALEQIGHHRAVYTLLIESAGTSDSISPHTLLAALKVGGAPAITTAIEQMAKTNNLKARKMLSLALGKLGEEAVPTLVSLMHDPRWFIIRNICAILGAIASQEAFPELTKCLHHPDLRVRKEAVRSLAQLGGHDAETVLVGILRGDDTSLHPQAITSLGGMKSRKALVDLLKIVCARDMFLKTLAQKLDALTAIASIGDKQVVPILLQVLDERHLLAAARSRQLKAAIATCLGKLGDARAIPHLGKLATESGDLGSASSEALTMIQKQEGTPDGLA